MFRKRQGTLSVYQPPVLLIVLISLLPTVTLLVISYFQSLAYARANLEGIIGTATSRTNQLLENANTILTRSSLDLQNSDDSAALKILRRQVYNDFRFREAGIINSKGWSHYPVLELSIHPFLHLLLSFSLIPVILICKY